MCFSQFQTRLAASLTSLFEGQSASTLAKHACGWRKWPEYTRAMQNLLGLLVFMQLFFRDALAMGAAFDRGMMHVGLEFLVKGLAIPNIEARVAQDDWTRKPVRQAVPLPLSAAAIQAGKMHSAAWMINGSLVVF